MSSGVLCVIVIPIEEETNQKEKVNQQKNDETQSRMQPQAQGQPFLQMNDRQSSTATLDMQYGTFHKLNTPYSSPRASISDNKSIEIDVDLLTQNVYKDDKRVKYESTETMEKESGSRDDLSNRSTKKKVNSVLNLEIPTDSTMQTILKEILKKVKIEFASWTKIKNDKFYQVLFTMECDEKYENLQSMLNEWGIGHRKGSTVTFANCSTFNQYKKDEENENDIKSPEEINAKQSAWNRFMNTMTARLNVAQIIRDVRQEATINFDFIVLVISAAVLASFGLVENSTIFLASSMLISPLMGPIIAGVFGTAIKDHSLTTLGVVNELIGIFLATFVGFIFGLIVCTIEARYNIRDDGLTLEMLNRTDLHSVLVGIVTAIVSGAAAAVGILGGNIGSLVGVAISASLLPPAVNAGLLWALSCIYMFYEPADKTNLMLQNQSYSDHQATELAILGLISMLVTITNIICVYAVGILILKIKEVAPTVSNKQFWRHDIKFARDFNKSCFNDDTSLANEIAALPRDEQNVMKCLNSFNIDDLSCQHTWSPGNLPTNHNPNLNDLEKYYMTIHSSKYTSRNNSICASKFRNRFDSVSNYMRRASMPFEILASPKAFRSEKSKLNTIEASPNLPQMGPSTKFTVSPVIDK